MTAFIVNAWFSSWNGAQVGEVEPLRSDNRGLTSISCTYHNCITLLEGGRQGDST